MQDTLRSSGFVEGRTRLIVPDRDRLMSRTAAGASRRWELCREIKASKSSTTDEAGTQARLNSMSMFCDHPKWLGLGEAGLRALPKLVRSLAIFVAVIVLGWAVTALRLDVCVGNLRPGRK
jgi:hypothetical protein